MGQMDSITLPRKAKAVADFDISRPKQGGLLLPDMMPNFNNENSEDK